MSKDSNRKFNQGYLMENCENSNPFTRYCSSYATQKLRMRRNQLLAMKLNILKLIIYMKTLAKINCYSEDWPSQLESLGNDLGTAEPLHE